MKRIQFKNDSSDLLLTASLDKKMNLIDIRDKKGIVSVYQHSYEVSDFSIIDDYRFVSANGKMLRLWDIRNGEFVSELQSGSKSLTKILYNDNKLYSSSFDGHLRIYRLSNNKFE